MKSFLFEFTVLPDNTLMDVVDLSNAYGNYHYPYHPTISIQDFLKENYLQLVSEGISFIRSASADELDFKWNDAQDKLIINLFCNDGKSVTVRFYHLLENPISPIPSTLGDASNSDHAPLSGCDYPDIQFFLENSIEGMIIHDEIGEILFANQVFIDFAGSDPIGKHLSDFFILKYQDYNQLPALLENSGVIPLQSVTPEPKSTLEFALDSIPVRYMKKPVWLSVVKEIPDIRSRYLNLLETEQRYRGIVSNMCTIAYAYRYDPQKDSFQMDWIDGQLDILPWDDPNSMFDIEKFYAAIDPRDLPAAMHKEEMLRKGKSTFISFRGTGGHGRKLWLTDHNWYVGKSEDGSYRFYGILTDLTTEKKIGNQLNQLWVAINNSSNTIIIVDNTGTIEFVNPAIKKDLGYDPEYFLGKNYRHLLAFVEDKQVFKLIKSELQQRNVWTSKMPFKTAQGKVVVFSVAFSPIFSEDDEFERIVIVSQNITEMLQLERQLFHKDKLSTIGMFASGIAHDFNNILQIIGTYSELIDLHTSPEDAIHTYIEQITKAKIRGARLIEHLISFGKPGIIRKKELMVQLLIDVNMSFFLELVPKRIRFTGEVYHHHHIYANETSMQQLLINLIKNAVQSISGSGEISLHSSYIRANSTLYKVTQDMISFEVEDTGCGIPRQNLEQILEPYFSTKDSGDGSGLGLAIVHSIVNDHNGLIQISSEEGKGTKITVLLPAIVKED